MHVEAWSRRKRPKRTIAEEVPLYRASKLQHHRLRWVSVLLGWLCLDPAIKARISGRLPGNSLKQLLGAADEFLQYHGRVDQVIIRGDGEDGRSQEDALGGIGAPTSHAETVAQVIISWRDQGITGQWVLRHSSSPSSQRSSYSTFSVFGVCNRHFCITIYFFGTRTKDIDDEAVALSTITVGQIDSLMWLQPSPRSPHR